jgi:hypothetical protein
MDRSARHSAEVALNAYISALQPTTNLARQLASAIAQMLADDQGGTVTITLPQKVLIVRNSSLPQVTPKIDPRGGRSRETSKATPKTYF